jgi:integrase
VSVRKRGPRAYQVRVHPFPAKTFPTKESADRYDLALLVRRAEGDRYIEPARTLAEEITAWLSRWEATGTRRPKTVAFYYRSAKFWDCLGTTTVPLVRRAVVEDLISKRAAMHPRSAKNELELLKRVLKDARARGQRIDETVLDIVPIRHTPRQGRALNAKQLWEFASWCPEHSKRLIQLAGMIGARQQVWFEMTDDLLDLGRGTLAIPPELAKNGKPHRVYLTSLEVMLFREQLLVRAPGTPLVFPTKTGRKWTPGGFRDRLWLKAIEAAVKNDSPPPGQTSIYEGFTFHLLRHTACSLMASSGMDPAVASERAGHTDGGALFLRTYRHLYEEEKRSQALRLEAKVLADLDESWTSGTAEDGIPLDSADSESGRYWARTSDPQLVELVLSQLS